MAGAALADAGLKQRTRFGTAALVVSANLPDVDVLAFLADTPAVALRRGWTHGVLAQALLPVLLTAIFVALDRWRPPREGNGRVRPLGMLALCYAGVLSHVAMDWLNNYGVRLLMPWSSRWFYGDAVFIIDPWLWLILAAGFVMARRFHSVRSARVAVALAALYIALMTTSASAARARVVDAWQAANGRAPAALMVGPVPVNPFRKRVIVDGGDFYDRGTFTWLPLSVRFEAERVPKGDTHPAVARARADPDIRALLVWSRFPLFETIRVDGGYRVTLSDMRFGPRLFSASTIVH